MIDVKSIIESIINDFVIGTKISQILLKAQIVASQIDDQRFASFIFREQHGYSVKDNLPDYRKLPATVQAKIAIPFRGEQIVSMPIELINDEKVKELISTIYITQSLTEIEEICSSSSGDVISTKLPAFTYPELEKFITMGSVQEAWQNTNKSRLSYIVESFKSDILAFFLKMNNDLNWDLDFKSKENQKALSNITYNITAAVANTGSGSVNTADINSDIDRS